MPNNPIIIRFSPHGLSSEYGVNIYYDNKVEDIQRIQYNAVIQYCGRFEDAFSIFHLYKDNIVLNRNKTDDNAYQLAIACSKSSFYPLTVLVNKKGLIHSIRTDVMLKRWEQNKTQLEYFVGEEAKRYISETENALKNEERIKFLIEKDMFFFHFFHLIYGFQPENESIKFELGLPVIPFKKSLKFDCTQNLDLSSVAEDGSPSFRVYQKGVLKDVLTIENVYPLKFTDAAKKAQRVDGYFEAEYEVLRENNFVESVKCKYVLKTGHEVLQETKMESYRIQEKIILPSIDEDLKKFQIQKEKMNKSFLGKVFSAFFD